MPKGKDKFNYKPWVEKAPENTESLDRANLQLVDSLDKLKEILSKDDKYIGFDTETTGLDHEKIHVVGYSFCVDENNAYYVPCFHEIGGLGEPALNLIYEKMCRTPIVFMFNMRYDVRVMEWYGFVEMKDKILAATNYTKEQKQALLDKLLAKPYMKYDMSKVNIVDVQAMVFLVDTNIKYPSLKKSEEYYLGWRGDSFQETLGDAANFYYLKPEEAYQYAAVDALGTYLLGRKLAPFLADAGKSGVLDIRCLQPLTRFENELTKIDVDRLKSYSVDLTQQIEACQKRCWAMAGEEYNLGSPVDNNRVLSKLNIHTGVTTSRGMSTSKTAIAQCLQGLSKDDPARQLLTDLVNYASLTKQRSSYVDNTIKMCESNEIHPNRLRFGYKTTEVPSGRFAAGGDKKNSFFSELNIQNITKPHVVNHYVISAKDCEEHCPEIWKLINESGTREECDVDLIYGPEVVPVLEKYTGIEKAQEIFNKMQEHGVYKQHCYRLLDWVFASNPWLIDGVEETVIEGFDQYMNIRAAFLPDDNYYWVSIDFNAEELRIPTLITKEPVWLEAFTHGKDIHKQTAIAIWGEENYDKNKRKIAKSANFGILYGQTGRNFADRFDMTLEEGNEFVQRFKDSLPVLFRWVAIHEKVGEKQGFVRTVFGRPIRVRSYFQSGEWGWMSYAKRMCVNGTVQGTGADIMKMVLGRLFNQFYQTRRTDEVRFKNMIHDEINYQMRKDIMLKVLPEIMDIMRVQEPDWEFPMDVGLEIGNRWGQSVPFSFKIEKQENATSIVSDVKPKTDPLDKKIVCAAFKVSDSEEVHQEEVAEEEAVKFNWEE